MMTEQSVPQRSVYISLRVKLLILLFPLIIIAFTAIFIWFYTFSSRLTLEDLQHDLMATALTAASEINGDDHTRLYRSGAMDDPTYSQISEQLRAIKRTSPKASGVYTYIQEPGEPEQVRYIVSAALPPGTQGSARDQALLAERKRGCQIKPENRPVMGTPSGPGEMTPDMQKGLQTPAADSEVWPDEYGVWLSGFAPIYNAAGQPVGAVGVDMCAADINAMQSTIIKALLSAFGLTLLLLAGTVYVGASRLTRPVELLTHAARRVGRGEYSHDFKPLYASRVQDEVSTLAQVFELMVGKVREREEKLKQQVQDLKIEIDLVKQDKQVQEITETDYFQNLQQRAQALRRRTTGAET